MNRYFKHWRKNCERRAHDATPVRIRHMYSRWSSKRRRRGDGRRRIKRYRWTVIGSGFFSSDLRRLKQFKVISRRRFRLVRNRCPRDTICPWGVRRSVTGRTIVRHCLKTVLASTRFNCVHYVVSRSAD